MNITFNFSNPNEQSDGIHVYRSLTEILSDALPAPLATLPPDATTFTDTTAVQGTLYHYRIGVFADTDEALGYDFVLKGSPDSANGPGPQKLIAGDWNLGLFGQIRSTDFVTYASLGTFLGITAGTAGIDMDWIKVAYKGKVLFIPLGVTRYAVPYSTVYSAGGVYGTNDDGLVIPAGALATNQYRPFNIGSWTLFPRIMKGCADGVTIPPNRDGRTPPATGLPENEFDAIMGAMHQTKVFGNAKLPGQFTVADYLSWPMGINASDTMMDMCQQPLGDQIGVAPYRGSRTGTTFTPPLGGVGTPAPGSLLAVNVQTATMVSTFFTASGASTIRSCWRGIIELAQ